MQTDRCDSRVIHVEKVAEAARTCLDEDELEELTHFFKTFSDANRIRILMALQHLVRVLQRLELSEANSKAVETFAARVQALKG